MEKPTGVIQKIVESLQQINALDVYSPIEKDIILHNLRAAYMIFLNIPVEEQSTENRVEKLFEESGERYEVCGEEVECEEKGEWRKENEEIEENEKIEENEEVPLPSVLTDGLEENQIEENQIEENQIEEEILEEEFVEKEFVEEEFVEEEPIEEEVDLSTEEEPQPNEEIIEEELIPEPLFTEAPLVEENVEPEPIPEPLFTEAPLVAQEVELQDDILEFIPDAKPQSHLLFDDLEIPKPEKKSLNDLLTENKDDNSLGARFQQSFIPDLTKAIGINEKFSFIRELFHNSGVDFSNAIQKLNDCDNIDSAFVLMEEFKHQYLWDTTSSAYLSLCDLVRRRFI